MPVLRQILLLMALALPPALGSAWWLRAHPAAAEPLRPYEVTLEQVRADPRPILWIDARPVEDYQRGHVPGALSLDEAHWEERLPAVMDVWVPDQKVVVYCGATACALSERVAERLRADLGTEDVYFLRGGYAAWQPASR